MDPGHAEAGQADDLPSATGQHTPDNNDQPPFSGTKVVATMGPGATAEASTSASALPGGTASSAVSPAYRPASDTDLKAGGAGVSHMCAATMTGTHGGTSADPSRQVRFDEGSAVRGTMGAAVRDAILAAAPPAEPSGQAAVHGAADQLQVGAATAAGSA